MKNLNFKSQREKRDFDNYLKGIEEILNISIEDLYKSEKHSIKALILLFVRCSKAPTKEKIEIGAEIIKKFLNGAQKYRKMKINGNPCVYATYVKGLLKSIVRPPKQRNSGRKRAINLTIEEMALIHKEREWDC